MTNKINGLINDCQKYAQNDVIVAFSGGVDSSLILKLVCDEAKKSGANVYAVTFNTMLHPHGDLEIAKAVAEELGAKHITIAFDELNDFGILDNPLDRCYICKKKLFTELKNFGIDNNINTILDGTNGDDLNSYRPGLRALKELGVISPLAENGITKSEVRSLAKEHGISTSNRPSAPCLATRFPYNTPLSYELLDKVSRGEEYVRNMGFRNVRFRVHGEILRIEVDKESLFEFLEQKDSVITYCKEAGFKYITLDLEGFRSGSMDE